MNPTCIIVDDHETLRSLLCDWLTTIFPNIKFTCVATGEAASDLAILIKPQVVLMDISLPGINGVEAARQIKNFLPETIVIIHTIHEDQAYREAAASVGVDGYITKSKTQIDLIPTLLKAFSSFASEGMH